ncbi:Cof-type HAD-IIB family hydrolase [Alkalibaculum bacchi]|uniref:Cof-type HAD-IIB family hydrolase n=1 Tax=Alkalibaculum bacchi TaxID=645887 RepID=UPI0026EA4B6B|nr:Cof-type HAD-IIB family hydrolase [Alkalibaculum bacchi]
MNYQLISTDMDGTLLDSDKLIPKENIEALHILQDKGIKIMFSTGRPIQSAMTYAASINIDASFGASNGAAISYEDYLETILLDKEQIIKTAKICDELNFEYIIYTENMGYYTSLDIYSEYHRDNNLVRANAVPKIVFNTIQDIMDLDDMNKIIKADFFDPKSRIMDIYPQFPIDLNKSNVILQDESIIEIINKKASKGKAVKKVAEYYKIPREKIIAIGDGGNDVSMLEYAGCGIAMGNAGDIVKSKADMVTDANDNLGFVKALEKLNML